MAPFRGFVRWAPSVPTDSGGNPLFVPSNPGQVAFANTASLDSFSRLRVSDPTYVFDAQLTYNLQPLLFEQLISGADTGAVSIQHDAKNRMAALSFTAAVNAIGRMQSFAWLPYQPGRSQLALVTFKLGAKVAGVRKFVGLGDTGNGIMLEQDGSAVRFALRTTTSRGEELVPQASWSIDPFDGTGPSGIVLDLTKVQILVIDYQALYVGRVRIGFDIGGTIYYAHEFNHANTDTGPYIATGSLPVAAGMDCDTGPCTAGMNLICSSVISEGGNANSYGFPLSAVGIGTAGNGTPTHILSVQPKTTYNGITNRATFVLQSIEAINTGNSVVRFDVLIGQALNSDTGANFVDVNTTHSAFEFNTNNGALTGSPAVTIASFYVPASATTKGSFSQVFNQRAPITLNAAGNKRTNGRISVQATGITASSDVRCAMNWIEVR